MPEQQEIKIGDLVWDSQGLHEGRVIGREDETWFRGTIVRFRVRYEGPNTPYRPAERLVESQYLQLADIIPCPDCGSTEDRDYTFFRALFAEPQRDMPRLLAWVRTQPCGQCAGKRLEQEKRQHQGGRLRKS
jgi:hypothetical protein